MRKYIFFLFSLFPLFADAQEADSTATINTIIDSTATYITNDDSATTIVNPQANTDTLAKITNDSISTVISIINSDTILLPTPFYKKKYNCTVLSIPYRVVRDEGHSPLSYRRLTYQISKYNERIRDNALTKTEIVLGLGFLKTSKKKISAVTLTPMLNMEINFHYMRFISKIFQEKGEFYIGGIFTNTIDGRLYTALSNNTFGYEFSNVLNPATQLSYNFTLGEYNRKYQFGFKMNTALLTHVIRPNFIGMEPVNVYEGEKLNISQIFINGNKIAFPNRFFRLNTELYIDRFQLSNKNKIRIFYGWGFHYTNLPQSNPLYSIYHNFGIVTMLYSEKQKGSIFKRKINSTK